MSMEVTYLWYIVNKVFNQWNIVVMVCKNNKKDLLLWWWESKVSGGWLHYFHDKYFKNIYFGVANDNNLQTWKQVLEIVNFNMNHRDDDTSWLQRSRSKKSTKKQPNQSKLIEKIVRDNWSKKSSEITDRKIMLEMGDQMDWNQSQLIVKSCWRNWWWVVKWTVIRKLLCVYFELC